MQIVTFVVALTTRRLKSLIWNDSRCTYGVSTWLGNSHINHCTNSLATSRSDASAQVTSLANEHKCQNLVSVCTHTFIRQNTVTLNTCVVDLATWRHPSLYCETIVTRLANCLQYNDNETFLTFTHLFARAQVVASHTAAEFVSSKSF